jgi:eukaryotic-like serine/threonine-protein kinase
MSPTPVGVVGERLGDRYVLVRPLARGGMAEVWEATDTILGRSVAAKILYPHLAADAGFRARFKREAVSAARLNHPAIVTVFDTGIDEHVPQTATHLTDGSNIRAYIIMEMVPGRTLRALMTEGVITVADAVSIVAQSADALAYAHAHGFVHRDVKPGNIMVQPDGRVKVADFGIAKTLQTPDGEDLTQAGSMLGTAKYLSPEQVDGSEVDARADIYSLGVVLYEAVCGRPPFVGSTDLATAMLHVNGTTQRPRQVRPELSRGLEQVIMTAMARDITQRYQRAGDVARALRSLNDEDDAQPTVMRSPVDHTPANGVATAPAGRSSLGSVGVGGRPSGSNGSSRSAASGTAPVDPPTVLMDERTRVQVSRPRPDADSTALRRAPKRARGRLVPLALVGALIGSAGGWVSGARSVSPVIVAAADLSILDPARDGENNRLLPNLVDGTRAAWKTSTYENGFDGLATPKDGVGVIFDLGRSRRIASARLLSLTANWDGAVFVADAAVSDLGDWTRVRRADSIQRGTTVIQVNATGRYVMLWVDDLGPNGSVSIAEVELFE